jgi:hypothetical protein
LSRSTLQGASFISVSMLIEAIEAFVASWNQDASPFEWTKAEVHQQQMKRYYSYLCNYILVSRDNQIDQLELSI